MPTATFSRFTPAASPRSVVAQGDAVEAGVPYGFMVFASGDVALTGSRGLLPATHKAPLRAAILAAYRAATAVPSDGCSPSAPAARALADHGRRDDHPSCADLYDQPLTRAGSGRAHLARGTSAPITGDGVARFLAIEFAP